jgi:arylsulfatase A-like enzyme
MKGYAGNYPHVTRALGAAARDFIRESTDGDQPFCLNISFKAPHKPPTPDPEFDHVYAGKRFSKPPNYGAHGMAHLPTQALAGRQFIQRNEWYPDDVYQERLRRYYQQIYGVDVALGMIRDELEAQGVTDNTVIIFTSDNGYFCGSHFMQGKTLPYEEASRAPLIVYDPRHPSAGKGLRAGGVTGNIDMAPTILELAGEPIPGNMDGKSLLPLLANVKGDVRESLFLIHVWEFDKKCRAFAAVTRDYKYIYWFYGDGLTEPAEELYALREDPHEMRNVFSRQEYRAAVEQMHTHYDANLRHWKENTVPGNGYPKYVKLADRNIRWQDKDF